MAAVRYHEQVKSTKQNRVCPTGCKILPLQLQGFAPIAARLCPYRCKTYAYI